MSQEIHLKLGVEHLEEVHKKKVPDAVRFYHFNRARVTALQFHEATLITFDHPEKGEIVIKDLYSRRQK